MGVRVGVLVTVTVTGFVAAGVRVRVGVGATVGVRMSSSKGTKVNPNKFVRLVEWMVETINKISPQHIQAKMSRDIPHLSVYAPDGVKYKVLFFSQYKEHPWTVVKQINVGQYDEEGLLKFLETLLPSVQQGRAVDAPQAGAQSDNTRAAHH